MSLKESGRVTPSLDRVYCRTSQDGRSRNRGDVAYRSIAANEDTQSDIALDACQPCHSGILRRNRTNEARLRGRGSEPHPSTEAKIDEASDFGELRPILYRRRR